MFKQAVAIVLGATKGSSLITTVVRVLSCGKGNNFISFARYANGIAISGIAWVVLLLFWLPPKKVAKKVTAAENFLQIIPSGLKFRNSLRSNSLNF